ncbi:hypothetical protein [uncultured Methanofollis sp.]|uniref:hypothetical protein n=1 Tax=uncultured Methanofollis sp. TaxID=262500 RepID=UPI00260D828F|nr:hypothetical protein [uncultured Methanofollis sp.]
MAGVIPAAGLRATGVGALPHRDPDAACLAVLAAFPEVPYAPTLPNRNPLEAIVLAEAECLPGAEVREGRVVVDTGADEAMERVFMDYLEGRDAGYAASDATSSGFHRLMAYDLSGAVLLKCQVTGPATLGMQAVDAGRRPVHYDGAYADVLGKALALRARWFEMRMREHGVPTVVVLNEPYLTALGSPVVPLDEETVRSSFDDVAALLEGGVGIHCCANTDWGFVFSLSPSLVSFDAHAHAREFLLYGDDLAAYLEWGGVVAWGMVPADRPAPDAGELSHIHERFAAIRQTVADLVGDETFIDRSLVTPTCGIRTADEAGAGAVMEAAAAVARRARGEGK